MSYCNVIAYWFCVVVVVVPGASGKEFIVVLLEVLALLVGDEEKEEEIITACSLDADDDVSCKGLSWSLSVSCWEELLVVVVVVVVVAGSDESSSEDEEELLLLSSWSDSPGAQEPTRSVCFRCDQADFSSYSCKRLWAARILSSRIFSTTAQPSISPVMSIILEFVMGAAAPLCDDVVVLWLLTMSLSFSLGKSLAVAAAIFNLRISRPTLRPSWKKYKEENKYVVSK
jgi:hypothetical protein